MARNKHVCNTSFVLCNCCWFTCICSQSQRSTETETESGGCLEEDPVILLNDKDDEYGTLVNFILQN